MQLQIKDLSKAFQNNKAVNNVNFTFENGVYGLLGANGAGKTTLMRMLCTLLNPTKGTVEFDGEEVKSMDERYRRILGYLPQDFGYYPEFTAEDYLLYIAALKGIKMRTAKRRVADLLETVSLSNVKKKKIKTFSGGMKRRLGIAQAILNDPKVLILDEPTSGLDPKERMHFRTLINRIAEGRIVLLSTHIVSDLESIAREILIMKEGSIIASGTTDNLLSVIEDKVWFCKVTLNDAIQITKNNLISNEKSIDSMVELRVISQMKPFEHAVAVKPALEDLFIFHFGEVEADADFNI